MVGEPGSNPQWLDEGGIEPDGTSAASAPNLQSPKLPTCAHKPSILRSFHWIHQEFVLKPQKFPVLSQESELQELLTIILALRKKSEPKSHCLDSEKPVYSSPKILKYCPSAPRIRCGKAAMVFSRSLNTIFLPISIFYCCYQ